MTFLNLWLQGIVVAVVIATILEMVIPNGNNKKYIKIVLGVYILFNIVAPVVNEFSNSNFELASIIKIEEYTKKMGTDQEISSNINKTNDENIRQIYITNLKNDIKAKLQERKYEISDIEINVDDSENYNIEKISIYLKENTEEKEIETQNKVKIDEIEKVKIQVGQNNVKIEQYDVEENSINSNATEKDKKQIKQYLSGVYEINENKINIY